MTEPTVEMLTNEIELAYNVLASYGVDVLDPDLIDLPHAIEKFASESEEAASDLRSRLSRATIRLDTQSVEIRRLQDELWRLQRDDRRVVPTTAGQLRLVSDE